MEEEEKRGAYIDRLANGEALKEDKPQETNLFMGSNNYYIEASSKLTDRKFKKQTIEKFNKIEAVNNVRLERIKKTSVGRKK